jgi:myo-inositol-1-phosphate synthase
MVKVAIVGVGNCASALVQGLTYYADADPDGTVPGLMHVDLGGIHVRDVEIVAAFDVDAAKVGTDVADAIGASKNNTLTFAEVSATGVTVQRGPTLDGLGQYYLQEITESDAPVVDVAAALRESGAEVVVSYLPVGSQSAGEHYAQAAIDAGCAFVNALPVFIASNPEWAAKFEAAGLPIVGDDVKSQVGATITHRVLARLFEERGVHLDRTFQLNVGGNMDFENMLERSRLTSKKISKTQAVTSNIAAHLPEEDIHIGPSDHVSWLSDRKWAYVRLEGRGFGDAPMALEYKLEVWDSPNSAGVIIDAIRLAKLGLDRGIGGPLLSPSAYLMKSPRWRSSSWGTASGRSRPDGRSPRPRRGCSVPTPVETPRKRRSACSIDARPRCLDEMWRVGNVSLGRGRRRASADVRSTTLPARDGVAAPYWWLHTPTEG